MILVTGANGLVGSYLCRYLLAQGEQVRALRRAGSDMRLVEDIQHRIEWVEGDVTDIIALEDAMQGIRSLYHCAGYISYLKRNAEKLMQVNAGGTANVVNLALEMGIGKMVHFSSISALGRTGVQNEVVTESAPWNMEHLSTSYAHSKFAAEREVWRGIAEGLNAVIVNPSIILGAGNWQSGSCKLFSTVYQGFPYYTEGVTGYVDVRDVVRVAVRLMRSDISGERFILNSENWMNRDLLQGMAKALQVSMPSKKAGPFLSGVAWRWEWCKSVLTGKDPAVTRQTARIANKSTYFSNEKVTQQLSCNFIPVATSIRETADAFLSEKQDGRFHPLSFN